MNNAVLCISAAVRNDGPVSPGKLNVDEIKRFCTRLEAVPCRIKEADVITVWQTLLCLFESDMLPEQNINIGSKTKKLKTGERLCCRIYFFPKISSWLLKYFTAFRVTILQTENYAMYCEMSDRFLFQYIITRVLTNPHFDGHFPDVYELATSTFFLPPFLLAENFWG